MSEIFDDSYDLVVVGAGWYGLAAAKAAVQIMNPGRMAILETAESCGGTWSKNRLYPGLKSNNMAGTYEYPDFPLAGKYNIGLNDHIPGAVLHQYLTDFAVHFGLFKDVQFHTKVDLVEPTEDGAWKVTVTAPNGQRVYRAVKIILATGLTSTPNMPEYKGAENFDAPLFHSKEFCVRAENGSLKNTKKAVVVGGAKSAYDVAYALAMGGSKVDLVIRDNGHGPVWIAPSRVTPFRKRLDTLLLVRWMTFFAPCPWGYEDGFPTIRKFLHGTRIGRWITDFFWKTLGDEVIAANGYDEHPEMKKLKPWNGAFWIASGLSIYNYDTSLWDLVRSGKVRVHIGQVDHLQPRKVILADGTTLDTDVMICSTGWKKESTIKFRGLKDPDFGLDCTPGELRAFNDKADRDVLDLFPRLKDQPSLRFAQKAGEPLRLYRFMVPSSHIFSRNIAFSGAVSTVSTSTCATIQGQWIATYLSNQLDRMASTKKEVTEEIMLHTQWGKWRFPCGYGGSLPDFAFEGLSYVDMLLRDMGLNPNRKGSWWRELTSPYLPRDFRGLVENWKDTHDVPLKKGFLISSINVRA